MRAVWLASALVLAACPATTFSASTVAESFEPVRHFAWGPEKGAPSNVQAIAQSPDGFLWLGTANGLYRFDGITFDRIPLQGGDGTQSLQVTSVAAAPNGDVWIGYDWGGIAVYRDHVLRPANPARVSKTSVYLAATPDGAIWARAEGSRGNRIIRWADGRWSDIDESWALPRGASAMAMLVARDGSLYLLGSDGLRRLRPRERRFDFQPLKVLEGSTIAEDPKGRIWLANADRLVRLEMGRGEVGPASRLPHSNLYRRLNFDAEGAAWLAGSEDGAHRLVPSADADHYSVTGNKTNERAGHSSNVTLSMLRDVEGNVWVGTLLGIDRFSVQRAIRNTDLPLSYAFDTFAGADGEAYLISNDNLFAVGSDGPRRLASIRAAETICGEANGLVVGTPYELLTYREGALHKIAIPDSAGRRGGNVILGCAIDPQGRLLLSVAHQPLYRLENGHWRAITSKPPAGPDSAYGMIPTAEGATLVVYPKDRIIRIKGDKIETAWTMSQGTIGFIKTAAIGRKCVMFGAQGGLGCLSGLAMKTLDASTYPQLTNVSGLLEAPNGWTWLIALSGIMRVRTDELYAAFDAPGRPLHFQPFGVEEGIRGESMMMHPRNVIADRFRRLWFFTSKGLVSLDLGKIDSALPPPNVVIKSLTANGRSFNTDSPIELPVGTRGFQIDYTATALTDPAGTTFRYKLEGAEDGWNDAGVRRQAFYTLLSPGKYRFRVSAISSAGAPSRQETVLNITIKPSFVQTKTFALLCGLLVLALGTLFYRWRLQALSARFRERMQERLDERERIARELHDTLLQGVSGLLLQFQGLAVRVTQDSVLRNDIETALDRAEDLVVEGRNRVSNLRGGDEPRDLEEILAIALTQRGLDRTIDVKMERSGTSKPVRGAAAEELAAIALEALGNAIRHGEAERLTVTMAFEARQLVITFEDDGIGIPDEIASVGSRPGHFGLLGMRERAERLKGTFQIGKVADRGTRIRVAIPRRIAYFGAGRAPARSFWQRISILPR